MLRLPLNDFAGIRMKRRLITFDWAMKRLLRSKANFEVLEGFLSELLKQEITILELLESESNKDQAFDKYNRVDLKVKNQLGEIIIIEVQFEREVQFLHRILYATSKTITEHMFQAEDYDHVVKVISINILYFDLGSGDDYIYHGTTRFSGIHQHDELQLSAEQRKLFNINHPHEIFPEYYLLKINQFDDIARDRLDEWVYFLKNEEIKEEFSAKGLQRAKELFDVMRLSESERMAYEYFIEDMRYQRSMFKSSYGSGHRDGKKEGREEGREEGRKEGREKGREEGRKEEVIEMARNMKRHQEPVAKIVRYTGLSIEEVESL